MEVIACLSKIIVRDATIAAAAGSDQLTAPQSSISSGCQAEVKFQLLQKHSGIKFNPVMARACKDELSAHCSEEILRSQDIKSTMLNRLECLKSLDHTVLSTSCRQSLMVEEKEEAVMNSVDYSLMKICKHEIKNYDCTFQGRSQINGIFNCLKDHRHEPTFDRMCLKIIDERIRERSHDYRLNPRLQAACSKNIEQNSQRLMMSDDKNENAESDFLEGSVIACLQETFLRNEKDLVPNCKHELTSHLRRTALDYKASPSVLKHCKASIKTCKKETQDFDGSQDDFEDGGTIEDCLRTLFRAGKLDRKDSGCRKIVAQRIQVSEIDMSIDPFLQNSCSLDLARFCRNVPPKDGKRLQCLFYLLRQTDNSQKTHNTEGKVVRGSNGPDKLGKECLNVLIKRSEMFKLAVKELPNTHVAAIRDINDLYLQLSSSPHRNYLLIVSISMLSIIFIGGLLCGRITKRARKEYIQKVR